MARSCYILTDYDPVRLSLERGASRARTHDSMRSRYSSCQLATWGLRINLLSSLGNPYQLFRKSIRVANTVFARSGGASRGLATKDRGSSHGPKMV